MNNVRPLLLKSETEDKLNLDYVFWCPACKEYHSYAIKSVARPDVLWKFDGNLEKPSFTPSLSLKQFSHPKFGGTKICHLFVTNGKIIYCPDCTHAYANKTIDMVPYDSWKDEPPDEAS